MKNVEDLKTPCLILDKSKLEKNCKRIREKCAHLNTTLRPHVKTPKSINIARIALDKENGPITVSTLKEADHFASSGFTDILYAVGIVSPKLMEIKAIQEKYNCKIQIVIDSLVMSKIVLDYSLENKVPLDVMLEIDSGEGRGGLKPSKKNIKEISSMFLSNKKYIKGVMTHAGHSYKTNDPKKICSIAEKERNEVLTAARIVRRLGHPCPVVSLGSTPTILFASNLDGVSEVRCGVYMFWDLAQASKNICTIEDIAVTVLATIIGHNKQKNKIIIDAGALALSKDISANQFMPKAGFGLICESQTGKPLGNLNISEVHQEHGSINIANNKYFDLLPIGSKVRILPNHTCITCAGHEQYNILEKNVITGTWPRINGW